MRSRAWEEIGQQLKIEAIEAKQTWDKLRRCFTNALNRRRHQTGRAAQKFWKYHKQMEFLEPHIEFKKLTTTIDDLLEVNFQEGSNIEEDEASPEDEDHPNAESAETKIKEEPIEEADQEPEPLMIFPDILNDGTTSKKGQMKPHFEFVEVKQINLKTEPRMITVESLNEGTILQKRRRNRQFEYVEIGENSKSKHSRHSFRNAEITSTQPNYSANFSPYEMDDTDLFFLSMAKMTKKLTLLQQAHIKSRLSREVLEAVIKREEEEVNSNAMKFSKKS